MCVCFVLFFFVKQKTAYEMRISDWSSDVCSSDLRLGAALQDRDTTALLRRWRRGVRGLLRNFLRGERQHRSNRLQESDPVDQRRCRSRQPRKRQRDEIGRASCRERGCQYVSISVVAVSLKKKTKDNKQKYQDSERRSKENRNKRR